MKVIAIIPARMGSSRFPGKPLIKINGIEMIRHVFNNVSNSSLINRTVVATCDTEIEDCVKNFGGEVIMTSHLHERASDRCAEAVKIVEKNTDENYDVVLMVQGDEPLINGNMISQSLQPFFDKKERIDVVNLMAAIKSNDELNDPNCIKVVCDKNDNALYFSRSPIPHSNSGLNDSHMKQVCVIPFDKKFLNLYNALEPTINEIKESVDMLRVIDHGYKVKMVLTNEYSHAVDHPHDVAIVESIMNHGQ